MLKSLEVKNFAIIDNMKLEFHQGMTVLTGETGAGKSIIVDAISLLLGDRATKEMISSKSDTAEIIGVFTITSKPVKNLLQENQIDFDESLEIYRLISKDKTNIIKINQQNTTLKLLKDLALYLADIHSQFDTNQLINPDNYLALVDNFRRDRINAYLERYLESRTDYLETYKSYQEIIKKRDETLKQLDLYQFQLSELNNLNLKSGELEQISEEVNVLENIDKINTVLQESRVNLSEGNLLDNLYQMKREFERLSGYSKDFEQVSERLNNLYYELDDINQVIIDKIDNLNYDSDDFSTLVERINELEKIQNKYHKSVDELIEYRLNLEEALNEVENFDEVIKLKEADVKKKYEITIASARDLSSIRKDIALRITKDIENTLEELVIKNAKFLIEFSFNEPKNEFDHNVFSINGLDQVEFLISTNKGEPLKSLARTASGGEMSRVMLAFKTIFARSQKIPTIIFDEIDTGISGYIAKQIARKLAELAKITQVISITHIPQVVAQGTHHLQVKKTLVANKMKIAVKYLNHEERIEEIAAMVSADKVTEAAKDIARELLINP
jgi:DNA repair protein RecN (Recombination protein N)